MVEDLVSPAVLDAASDKDFPSSFNSSSSISKGEALLLPVIKRLSTIGDNNTPILDWCNMLGG